MSDDTGTRGIENPHSLEGEREVRGKWRDRERTKESRSEGKKQMTKG